MKSIASALLFAALLISSASALVEEKLSNLLDHAENDDKDYSKINIEVDGESKTFYIAANFTNNSTSSDDYGVPAGGRGYISNTPTLDVNNPDYFKPNLLGASVEWDVDLSKHECGCIAAFYTVKMPGVDWNGDLWMNTDTFGYCDAN